MNRNHYN